MKTKTTRVGNGAGGPGWGGPAKGASSHVPAAPFVPETARPAGLFDPAARRERKAMRLAAADEAFGTIADIMRNGEVEANRLAASRAIMDRVEGLPVARNLTVETADPRELSDAQLVAIIAGGGAED